ncbi:MAG: bacillithiol biosynthesis deacetylase BshB1 [Myxococcales bacterium]|nr:bacillithiol biosynthesis deacetylase BshB1 [Myxococcales bacterium]
MTAALACLALAPHPDDAEICCGGLLASLAARGYDVGILDLTAGELATQGTPEQRAEESRLAAEALGLGVRENLGLPDGGLDAGDREQLAQLVGALRRLRPELVLAPYREARHPDHVAASALAERAVFFCGLRRFDAPGAHAPFRPRALLSYQMRVALRPSFVVDISAHVEAKRTAIRAHASQIARDPARAVPSPDGPSGTTVSSPSLLEQLDARDRYFGAMIGATHGEPYLAAQALPVADPVALLRGGGAPLFFPGKD